MFHFFKRNKTSEIVIDPENLTDQNAGYLKALLNIHGDAPEVPFGAYSLYNPKTKHTTQVRLIHTLLKKVNERMDDGQPIEYYVLLNKSFDKGAYGSVSRTLGTLVDYNDGRFSFNKKTRATKKQPLFKKGEIEINAILEPMISSQFPYLHVKQVGDSADDGYTQMVMRMLEKQSLAKIIDNKERLPKISSLRRLTMTLNSLRALRDQVHKQRIIHRDVKPDNIMVDAVGNVKFIDFGLSRFELIDDPRVLAFLKKRNPKLLLPYIIYSNLFAVGAPAYISPEAYKKLENNQHSDVYSLGLLLLELWGMKSREACFREHERMHGKTNAVGFIVRAIVLDSREPAVHQIEDMLREDLSDDLAQRIFAALIQLVAFNPDNRLTTDDAIAQLEQIRLEHVLGSVPASKHQYIHAAFQAATNLREPLNQLFQQNYLVDYKALKQTFHREFAKLDETIRDEFLNDAQAFSFFKEMLGINGFVELNNFNELNQFVKTLNNCFWQNLANTHALIKNIQYVLELKQNHHFKSSLSKLSELKLDLFLKELNHLADKFQKRHIDIDDLVDFNKRTVKTLTKIEAKFYALINPFFKGNAKPVIEYYDRITAIRNQCEQQHVDDGVGAIKNALKQAVLNFINEVDSIHRLLGESTHQLHDRTQLASPIVDLVMRVDDEQELNAALAVILRRLEVTSHYGRQLAHGVNQALHSTSLQNNPTRRFKP